MKQFYLFITFMLFITAPPTLAQNCNDLEILTTTNGSVCGEGSVTLSATASGTGDDIFWYDAATGGNWVGSGATYVTPPLTAPTSYWATEIIGSGSSGSVGPTGPTAVGTISSYGTDFYYTEFTVKQATVLISVDVFVDPVVAVGTSSSISIEDTNGNLIQNIPYTTTVSGNSTPQTVALNVPLSPGNYRMKQGTDYITLYRNTTGASYPYTSPEIDITGNNFNVNYYYWFYNFQFSTLVVTCESPRVEVFATLNNQADEEILTLPYTHTASTFDYDNNYSGAPGTDCGTTNSYLDGYDVVYKYTADDDYILNIELSGLTESHTAVFIYESCMDIGNTCYAEGSVNENIGTHSFQVSVEDTKDYYIVVSSASPTDFMNYTLTVTGTTCANYPAPTGPAAQSYINTQTLADLDVTGLDLKWYSDAALANNIPNSTVLVNGTTYYVTQSFQGCESAALAITVNEAQCNLLDVLSSVDGSVCGEGSVILTAQGAGAVANTALYWYENATGGNHVGVGSQFTTPKLQQTTSYWVAEVALSGGIPGGSGAFPTYCIPTFGTGCTSSDTIDDFIIEDASGNTILSHLNSGCSPNGYGNFTADANLNPTFEAGKTYSFTATHSYSTQRMKIWIDFNKDGIFDDVDELVFTSPTGANPTIGTFTIPANVDGNITGMRVFNNYSSLPTDACTSASSFGEVHDYKVNISGASVVCESPRTEVIATVNEMADEQVTEPLPYVHTANTSVYGNNYEGEPGGNCNDGTPYLDGNETVYQYNPSVGGVYSIELSGLTSNNAAVFVYESCYDIGTNCWAGAVSDGTTGNILIDEVPMYDGFDYFIVVTTATSASTDYTLTVDFANINCSDYTAAPGGDADQFFEAGDTLDDLVVYGGNLTWYSDAAGTISIPNTTLLVDGTTYYVKQTLNGCDSNLLGITVHEIDCSNLEIVSTVDGNIVCKGVAQLEAVGNGGLGTDIYWYSSASGGDPIAFGPTFTTPILTNTTSYWVSEVFLEQGAGNNTLPTPCIPVHGSSGCSGGDNIDNFILSQGGTTLISHIGTGCSANNYGNFINDSNLTATLLPNTTYDVAITHTYQTSNWVKIWIDFDFDGTFDEATELVFQSTAGSTVGQTNGTFTIPSDVLASNTIMRVSTRFSALPDNACQIGGTYGETHDYKITIIGASVLCESPREEVVATVSQDGDIIVTTLPYIDTNTTTTFGNTFTGTPGTNCGTTENYLNGNETVYMHTATMDDLVDITLKDITGYYAGVFVYESCGDIGTNCVAGVVAGPSDNDIQIKEFPFVTGQTYYIVVSSWLTPTIDYTLEIKGFDCATFPAPVGDANQDFVAPAFVSDLEVEGTMSASVLNWYSDAAGTISITDPTTTPLVNGATYYVSQTYGTCESPLLAITVTEIDCSDLDITNTVDGNVMCLGSMTLSATASGTGSEIYWYDSSTSLNPIAFGPTFTTPPLSSSRSYWVSEVLLASGTGSGGPLPTYCIPTFTTGCTSGDLIDDFILEDQSGNLLINHLNTGCSPNGYADYTNDPSLTATLVAGQTYNFTSTANFSSQRIKIWIDLNKDGVFDDATELLYESPSGANPVIGSFTIPHNATGNTTVMRVFDRYSSLPTSACDTNVSFGEVHDYKVTIVGASMICESPRVEVFATVSQSGDKLVGALNYTDTDNTVNYGNNFSGTPGCDYTLNYLDGNDIVYKYSPVTDDIINIELTNVTNNSTGVFVYQSCGDVGTNCLAGATSVGGVYLIEDFYATGGQDYFIVISSETGSTNYTLNIYGFDCNNAATPSGDATQYFVGTKYLTDLDIDEHTYSTGLNWYEDAAGTQPINDPTTWQLVHNTTYYVSQTVLGCESDLFAITAMEFDCVDLEIITTTDGIVCQSGSVTLTAQAGGVGSDIYWYSQQNGGDPIYIGNTFVTPILTNTETYWVTEVYTESGTGSSGPLPTYCIPTFGTGCTSGDMIEDFILEDQSGNLLINHLNSGCSPNGYGDYTNDSSLTATLIGGQTYNFTSTANFSSQQMKIWIDFNKDGVFDSSEIVYQSTSGANPINGTFTIPSNVTGNTTVMRVFDRYSSLPQDACTPGGSWGEVHDYRVTIVGATVLCEASRVPVIAEVNTTLPDPPTGSATQNVCGVDSTISDLVVTGTDIRWYDSNGTQLSANSVVVDGGVYYATQTVNACEGPALEVTVALLDKSDTPIGDRNQGFYNGQTLADLNVTGVDLKWYADLDKMIPLPDTTPLVDQTTYYVSQTESGYCESDLKPITVHRFLGVQDETFRNVSVLPIPTSDKLTISNTAPIESVELFNLLGQRVLVKKAGFQNEMELDVSFLSSGTYLLNVIIDGKIGTFKVIKE